MRFELPKSNFPLLSSYRGRIGRLLIVDYVEYDETEVKPDVLINHKGIVDLMRIGANRKVHFDILVQFNFDVSPSLKPWSQPFEIMRQAFIDEYFKILGNDFTFTGPYSTLPQAGVLFQNTYSLIFPNLDGALLIKQFEQIVGTIPIKKVADLYHLYQWIQDPFIAIEGPSGLPGFLEPYFFWPFDPKPNSKYDGILYALYLPDILSSVAGYFGRASPFVFQGGDVLVGNDYAIVSRAILSENHDLYHKGLLPFSLEECLTQMANSFGLTDVICPDGEPYWELLKSYTPPDELYHLDVFVTLAGQSLDGEEVAAIGKLHEWNGLDWKEVESENNIQTYLDNYATCLEGLGHQKLRFTTRRIPLFIDGHLLYSYNNCLVEIDANGWRRVILPKFSTGPLSEMKLKMADEMARKAWSDLGFLVEMIEGDFVGLTADSKAGLRCRVNVVGRRT
jgi:hypothetical protein